MEGWDEIDDIGRQQESNRKQGISTAARMSFKVVHKYKEIGKTMSVKGDAPEIDPGDFAKQGRRVVSCTLRGPRHPATHWEIMCEIQGLYGKKKHVKFHLSNKGYFSIYNAAYDVNDPALMDHGTAAPLKTVRTTDDLYRIFHAIALEKGPHDKVHFDCEAFAREFFRQVTGRS